MPPRRRNASPPDLNETLELLALRIGDRIGEQLARTIGEAAARGEAAPGARRCEREGCDRPATARGLCKSHDNPMLYHRRKAERGAGGAGAGTNRQEGAGSRRRAPGAPEDSPRRPERDEPRERGRRRARRRCGTGRRG